MSTPRRILVVGYFQRKALYQYYYNHEHKLANGFIRAGHNVISFSDRDHAREATRFHTQKLGKGKMADQLVETAKHYKPHLVLFGHADLMPANIYDRLRDAVPGVRLATFCVDALFRDGARKSFETRASACDAAFITTGDREKLAALNVPAGRIYFLPNPVDPSIETRDVSTIARLDLPYDGQFLGTGTGHREEQLRHLLANLPQDYRFHYGGLSFNTERLTSTTYMEELCLGAVCPNIPIDDRDPAQIDYLYSSDRIAQTVGQGVTTLTMAEAGLADLYEGGVVEYANREDLVAKMVELRDDDERRRAVGALGRRLAHERTNNALVADYILAASLGENGPAVHWNGDPV